MKGGVDGVSDEDHNGHDGVEEVVVTVLGLEEYQDHIARYSQDWDNDPEPDGDGETVGVLLCFLVPAHHLTAGGIIKQFFWIIFIKLFSVIFDPSKAGVSCVAMAVWRRHSLYAGGGDDTGSAE